MAHEWGMSYAGVMCHCPGGAAAADSPWCIVAGPLCPSVSPAPQTTTLSVYVCVAGEYTEEYHDVGADRPATQQQPPQTFFTP